MIEIVRNKYIMKLIIYAIGQIFLRCKNKINWEDVVALVDKKSSEGDSIVVSNREYPIIDPITIPELQYDYIVVFSNLYFEEIRMELSGKYFIPKDKIIPYREIVENNELSVMGFLEFCQIFCREKKCRKILDCSMSVLPRYYLTAEELFPNKEISIDGLSETITDFNVNLYQNIYQSFSECDKDYDMILIWKKTDDLETEIENVYKKGRYILFPTSYLFMGKPIKELLYKRLSKFGEISCISCGQGLFWVIDTATKTKPNIDGKNISIYVVTHKKYNCLSNHLYKPLCVGGYVQEGHLTEQVGDNISELNEKINECTALYWIWKNTKEEFIGLNHYRRYFYNNEIKSMDNYLDVVHICKILEDYDIILPKAAKVLHVYKQLAETMDSTLFENSYKIIRNLIKEKQPNYLKSFDSVMEGGSIFTCNMFVARREILSRYCEWLFSFLIKAAEDVNVEGYDDYNRRAVGFFAERMWTVWLQKNKLRIKELPYGIG